MASGRENQQGLYLPILVGCKLAGNPETLLYSPHTDSLTCRNSPGLWWKDSSSGVPGTCGELLSCVAFRRELEGQEPLLSLYGA